MTTAVATRPAQAVALKTDEQLRDFLTERQGEFAVIAKASGVGPEVLVAELVVAARKNPEILDCTPESIVTFMYDSAKTGLIIGRGCFAVPVKKHGVLNLECWIGAHGMRELVKYSGGARDVFAQVVYFGDPFEETLGLYPDVKHSKGPNFGDMDQAIGVYAVLVISQSIRRHVYLTKEKIERLRRLNRADTTKPTSPWVAHKQAMWEAKAILVACKTAPRNPRLAHAMAVFDKNEGVDLDTLETVKAEVVATVAPAEAKANTPEAGEAATERQVAFIKQLAQSHHWTEKQRAGLIKRADAATKEQAKEIIDNAQAFIAEADKHERAAKQPEVNATAKADDDDLPF